MMAAMVVSCSDDFDDSGIWDRIDDMTAEQEELNSTLEELQEALTQLDSRLDSYDKATSIETLTDNEGEEIGYTIYFLNSDPVVISYGEDGSNGDNGSDGNSGDIVTVDYTDGQVTITVTDSDGKETEYSFSTALVPVIAIEESSYELSSENSTISFTVSSSFYDIDVVGVYANVVDDTNGIGAATLTKAGSPTSEWSVSIEEGDAEGSYEVTLELVSAAQALTNGILTITVEDQSGMQATASVPFSYNVESIAGIMFSIAELKGGFVNLSNYTTWTVTDMLMSDDDFGYLKTELQAIAPSSDSENVGSISLNFPNLLSDIPSAAIYTDGIFYQCYALGSVSMPYVNSVGSCAFNYCEYLTNVELANATTLGGSAFASCTALESISLPELTTTGKYAFSKCTSLTTINDDNTLDKLTTLAEDSFSECTSLRNISLPNVVTLEDYAIQSCTSLESISLPEATKIGDAVFYGCTNLESVWLPKATEIDICAFAFCENLKSVEIATENTLTFVGEDIFFPNDDPDFTPGITLTIGSTNQYSEGGLIVINGNQATFDNKEYTFAEIKIVQQ